MTQGRLTPQDRQRIAAGLAAALAWVLSLPRLAPRVPESVA